MTTPDLRSYRYRFTGHERILHNVEAAQVLPAMMDLFGYRRAFIVASRTINTQTSIVQDLRARLGDRCVGLTDDVGEHSPLPNIIKAAQAIKKARADVIVSVGGGSVMDMCKAIQLSISEQAFDRETMLRLQFVISDDGTEMLTTSTAPAAIRQIAIPTTLATSEWTPVSTPIDTETSLKARFVVPDGSPIAIIYDPKILAQTPTELLMSTGIRGLDHAINTACSSSPHPFATHLAEKAVQLFVENLPLLKDPANTQAFTNCQLAAWYTGMGQMSVPHGFSHWMVHIIGPYGSIPHSDAACPLMYAQAKWLKGWAADQHARMLRLLQQPTRDFHEVLGDLLERLEMPLYLEDLGLTRARVDEMIVPALQHPMVTRNNIRPIRNELELRAVLELAWRTPAAD
ncbi:iron-containing alcohol dehydrogenase [Variovorax ginsengisoli]|uniref:Iron-containing alcohol dehydrogenase n=1 Tax=Variovorax ginsengisoli TaxID=363844 RepID=A0ABT8SCP5_9BURK|nr:iron-containing alcohol dehydrogenase [Variovorax ginsengisoli]MDN8617509.1 iron-containing alcohol dehydrogenase [Variovorax ginsengisoli]MDO1536679.1 iron-containing alcohol dehydrogenase [Variovorax ginsengisoli]